MDETQGKVGDEAWLWNALNQEQEHLGEIATVDEPAKLRHSPAVREREEKRAVSPSSQEEYSLADAALPAVEHGRSYAHAPPGEGEGLRLENALLQNEVIDLRSRAEDLEAEKFVLERRVSVLEEECDAMRNGMLQGLRESEGKRLELELFGPDVDVRDFGRAFDRLREATRTLGTDPVRDAFQKYLNHLRESLVSQPASSNGFGSFAVNKQFARALNEMLDVTNLRLDSSHGPATLSVTKPRRGPESGYFGYNLVSSGLRGSSAEMPELKLTPRPARIR